MEAFEAGKPVITVTDAGGVLDIVEHDRNGQVTEPELESLAKAMSLYLEDADLARMHGLAGRALWRSKGITWSETINQLLGS
jgi:glycosyltransferase involved in cell wall biosynthesis